MDNFEIPVDIEIYNSYEMDKKTLKFVKNTKKPIESIDPLTIPERMHEFTTNDLLAAMFVIRESEKESPYFEIAHSACMLLNIEKPKHNYRKIRAIQKA